MVPNERERDSICDPLLSILAGTPEPYECHYPHMPNAVYGRKASSQKSVTLPL